MTPTTTTPINTSIDTSTQTRMTPSQPVPYANNHLVL
eukprot:CAMPEP_0194075694 /NCGR_PEP_ID=MMETSP0149-20130528/2644_1 /TAXON_ID=122233 /ORGANISM="Chaetoceros debilis, Strain MM31A-1" /LENGTH=36 /DNA_ID= /DNA_START= /DNA_END= /DNA_ORIENTATION=